ncbi:MAG: type III pantothenate kinase, partial [Eggerthellaceae bacterium]|nr:type III pantothenate kinase [Eggerthellaceae bacterium]
MLLAIDIGNSHSVLGAYVDGQLVRMWRLTTNRLDTADELRVTLIPLLESEGLSFADVTLASLASVVP